MGVIFSLFRLVPFWVWIVVGVSTWGYIGHTKANYYKSTITKAEVETQVFLRKAEQSKVVANRKVEESYAQKARAANISADALRTANERLLILLSDVGSTTRDSVAVCGVDGARGRRLEELIGESADLLRESTQRTLALTAKIAGLQEYATSVCVKPPEK